MLVLPPIHILQRLDEYIGSGFNLIYRPRILIHDGLIKVEAVAVSHIFSLVFRLSVFLLFKGHILPGRYAQSSKHTYSGYLVTRDLYRFPSFDAVPLYCTG